MNADPTPMNADEKKREPRGTLFDAGEWCAREMTAADIPALQAFFEANPEYDERVLGAAPKPDAGRELFEHRPPAEWPYSRLVLVRFDDAAGAMAAVAHLAADLPVAPVWHIGLFMVATELHGSGAAQTMYHALESWIASQGARWTRLAVVAGNTGAELFWEKVGYVETCRRHAVPLGARVHELRILYKPLGGGTHAEYLALVPRDRPVVENAGDGE